MGRSKRAEEQERKREHARRPRREERERDFGETSANALMTLLRLLSIRMDAVAGAWRSYHCEELKRMNSSICSK